MKKILLILVIILGCLYLSGCSDAKMIAEEDSQSDIVLAETRGTQTDPNHWECKEFGCGYKNPIWRSRCYICKAIYSEKGGNYCTSIQDALKHYVDPVTSIGGAPIDDITIGQRVELPAGGVVLEFAPQIWFTSAKVEKYYNDLKAALIYNSDRAYAEGVNYAWYHTVRMLYPEYISSTKAESLYSKFVVSSGSSLRDSKGQGIMAGTKAAVDAYKNR